MRLSHDQRIQIVTLQETGWSYRALAQHFGVRPATVSDLINKHRKTGSVNDLPHQRRPKKTTPRLDRYILRETVRCPQLSSRALSQQLNQATGVELSARSIRSRLLHAGFHSYVAQKKPLLTARHRLARLQWARERVNMTVEEWRAVLFSDETPLHLIQNSRRYYRSRRGSGRVEDVVRPRLQGGGGSMMVWGAFCGNGRSVELHRVPGTLNASGYIEILEDKVLPFMNENPGVVFQQDNATSHKARTTMAFLEEHGIVTMTWPACSPDLNPIENIWAYLKSDLDKQTITNLDRLFESASQIMREIPHEIITNLMESMPERCRQVIARHGRSINY